MEAFQLYLEEQLPQGDCLKLVKQEAARFQQTNTRSLLPDGADAV